MANDISGNIVNESVLRQQAKPIRRLMLATGRDRAPRLPEIVQIESTNICNAKCVFCPRDEMHRRQGIISAWRRLCITATSSASAAGASRS